MKEVGATLGAKQITVRPAVFLQSHAQLDPEEAGVLGLPEAQRLVLRVLVLARPLAEPQTGAGTEGGGGGMVLVARQLTVGPPFKPVQVQVKAVPVSVIWLPLPLAH